MKKTPKKTKNKKKLKQKKNKKKPVGTTTLSKQFYNSIKKIVERGKIDTPNTLIN
jgi:ribosomal protein S25